MDSILDGVTGALVGKSLDLSLLRHKVIANNIANAETKGYRALRVNFARQMEPVARALARAGVDPAADGKLLEMVQNIDVDAAVEVDELAVQMQMNTGVQIEKEMTALVKNTINYQALLTANGKLGSLLSMAIKEGRG